MTDDRRSMLAAYGGKPIRTEPWPERNLMGREERTAADALFDETLRTGKAFGYGGDEEQRYCEEFAEFMGGGYADAVSSGTAAVFVALRALDLEPFTEVVVGPITDPGGIMPIPLIGCVPIVADAAPGSYNTGPAQIEEVLSDLTRAIVVPHVFGEPADMEGIMELAGRHGISVIEDCAQAHDARLNGQLLGTFGDLAAFSTMSGKHHCTGGQGGVVFTRNQELYQASRRASDRGKPFGLAEGSTNSIAALNLNLNDLAAAIGRQQLKKLPGIVDARRRLAGGLEERIAGVRSIRPAQLLPGAEPSYWYWRAELMESELTVDKSTYCDALEAEGILFMREYRAMPHTQDWYRQRRVFGSSGFPWTAPQYKGQPDRQFSCPNAHDAIARHINFHIRESWTERETDDMASALRKLEQVFIR